MHLCSFLPSFPKTRCPIPPPQIPIFSPKTSTPPTFSILNSKFYPPTPIFRSKIHIQIHPRAPEQILSPSNSFRQDKKKQAIRLMRRHVAKATVLAWDLSIFHTTRKVVVSRLPRRVVVLLKGAGFLRAGPWKVRLYCRAYAC